MPAVRLLWHFTLTPKLDPKTCVFGTARMGKDPDTSVVDEHCRSQRWRNLMATDANVFPSSGGGESPSLAIYASSLRAAHYVKAHGLGPAQARNS